MMNSPVDPNCEVREMIFAALFRGRRGGLVRAVQLMRERAAAGVQWSQIDPMFDERRLNPEDRGVYRAVADALKAYARCTMT